MISVLVGLTLDSSSLLSLSGSSSSSLDHDFATVLSFFSNSSNDDDNEIKNDGILSYLWKTIQEIKTVLVDDNAHDDDDDETARNDASVITVEWISYSFILAHDDDDDEPSAAVLNNSNDKDDNMNNNEHVDGNKVEEEKVQHQHHEKVVCDNNQTKNKTAKPTMLVQAVVVRMPDKDDDNDNDNDEYCHPERIGSTLKQNIATAVAAAAASLVPQFTVKCVELWATAPAPFPLRPITGSYDKEFLFLLKSRTSTNKNDCTALEQHDHDADDAALAGPQKAMEQWGLLVQPALLDQATVRRLYDLVVEQAITRAHELLATHRPHLTVGHDFFVFAEMASRSQQRFDLRLSGSHGFLPDICDFVKSHILPQRLVRQLLCQILLGMSATCTTTTKTTSLLQEKIDFDVSVVYSRPGAGHQGWHADGDHLGPDHPSRDATVVKPPYAVCLFVPLIDLNDEVGFTQFWPGSHAHRALVGFGPVAELTQAIWNGTGCCGRAGDAIWYDYRLLHRGMPNSSKEILRPVLQIIFKRTWYKERANYGTESIIPATVAVHANASGGGQ